jgi:hypothetical protein
VPPDVRFPDHMTLGEARALLRQPTLMEGSGACALCGHVPLQPLDHAPRVHRDGPDTERAAAALAWPRAGNSRHRILRALQQAGDEGRTFAELERELGMFSARQRLNDLKAGGWTLTDGRTRLTPRGAPAEVHVLSLAARERLGLREAAA